MKNKFIRSIEILFFVVYIAGCRANESSIQEEQIQQETLHQEIISTIYQKPTSTSTQIVTIVPTKTILPESITIPEYPNRYTESSGSIPFSYVPPKGWKTILDVPGKIVAWGFGEGLRGTSACGIYFDIESTTLSDPMTIAEDKKLIDQYNVKAGYFNTESGLMAYKIVSIAYAIDGNGQFTYYIFTNDTYSIIAFYDHLWGENNDQDIVVDQSMKTMQIED